MKRRRKSVIESSDRSKESANDKVVVQGNSNCLPNTLRETVLPAALSALLLWASFAPLSAGWLAWLAVIGWLKVVETRRPLLKRDWFWLWLSGCAFWLMNLHGIRLAFWALIFGWLALSLYLAVFIPLFVGLTRIARQSWRWPLWIAAPVMWVGLEVARSFLISGYAASQLSHSQAHYPMLLQVADQLGGYGISFVIVSVNVACFELWQKYQNRTASDMSPKLSILFACILLAGTLIYGWWRLRESDQLAANSTPLLKVALIQENTPTIFDADRERPQLAWLRYQDATREAAQRFGVANLVVWPESTFTAGMPWLEVLAQKSLPEPLSEQFDVAAVQLRGAELRASFEGRARQVIAAARNRSLMDPEPADLSRPHLLVGCDTLVVSDDQQQVYNSAIFVSPDGTYADRYEKMHLVMFGEYIPLGPLLKFVADAFGIMSATPGTKVKCFEVAGAKLAPNICFESMLPELVSWQVRQLVKSGDAPDVLINVTNDSWFWGSSMLDHHIAASILCAVENRRPLLVAANTGLTAEIDGAGRVKQVTQRMEKAILLAQPHRDNRSGLVQQAGYPLAWLCCALCAAALMTTVPSRYVFGIVATVHGVELLSRIL